MAHERINKSQWPSDLQGYSIGKDGYLLVSFDQGEHWYEIETARDVTLNFTTGTIDTTCRRSGRYRENLPLINELTVDAEMIFDIEDPVVKELIDQSQSGGIFLLGVFTDDGNGPVFYGCSTDMGRPEELEGVVRLSAKYSLTRFKKWWKSAYTTSTTDGGTTKTLDSTHPIAKLPSGTVTSVVVTTTGASQETGQNGSP